MKKMLSLLVRLYKLFVLESIKYYYDEYMNKQLSSGNNTIKERSFYELVEYLIMKTYFIIPFYPIFKAQTLRKDFNFSKYLKLSIIDKINSIYNLTLMAWILIITYLMIWNVFISNCYPTTKLVLISIIPLICLIYLIVLFFYLNNLVKKILPEVNNRTINEYLDMEHHNQNFVIGNFASPPIYINKYYENNTNNYGSERISNIGYSFTEHITGRSPTFFEDTIIFGVSGQYIIHNTMQSVIALFISTITIIIIQEGSKFHNYFGSWIIPYFSILNLFYFVFFSLVVSFNLKNYTIYTSVEMNKNKEIINKCIQEQTIEDSKLSEELFKCYKKIYFDLMINSKKHNNKNVNFNSLNRLAFTKLIDLEILRFKKYNSKTIIENNISENNNEDSHQSIELNERAPLNISNNQINESNYIVINNELKSFLASTGNELENEDIEFMLHLIEDLKSNNNKILTSKQLYDIWGALIHFSSKHPSEIIIYVFENYYEDIHENTQNVGAQMIDSQKLKEFLNYYNEYFSESVINYALKEANYLGKEFSIQMLISSITNSRKYYPN